MNIQSIKKKFKEKGYIVIKNFYKTEKIGLIKKSLTEFKNFNQSNKFGHSVFEKVNKKKLLKYFKKINLYIDDFNYLISEKTLTIASKILNQNVYYYNMGLHNKPPGMKTETPTHQDNFYWNLKPKYGLTAYVPLDEQNKKNGGLAYYCGSHNGPTYKHKKSKVKAFSSYVDDKLFKNYKLEYVDVKPGDLILHHCNTAHKTSKNLTNKHRNAVAITIYGEHAKIDSKMKNIYLKNLKS